MLLKNKLGGMSSTSLPSTNNSTGSEVMDKRVCALCGSSRPCKQVCIMCGSGGTIEHHHVAGRRNDPAFMVTACVICHRSLSILQRWYQIPLSAEDERPEIVKSWTSTFGAFQVIATLALRTGKHPVAEMIWNYLDGLHLFYSAAEKPNEVIPRVRVEKLCREPAPQFEGSSTAQVVGMMAEMGVYFLMASPMFGRHHRITRFLLIVADHPEPFVNRYRDFELSDWGVSAPLVSRALNASESGADITDSIPIMQSLIGSLEAVAGSYLEEL